jgi:hypothetical protein
VISTPEFGHIITQKKLEVMSKFLHFGDNEITSYSEGPEKLFKIFPVILHVYKKFQELPPKQDKTYKLFDTTTGYLWSSLIYIYMYRQGYKT